MERSRNQVRIVFPKYSIEQPKLCLGPCTSSAKKLFIDLGWETPKERHDFLGLTLFHKLLSNLTRPLVRQCMPISNTNTQYQLRNSPPYQQFKYHNKKYNDSFFPYFTRKFGGPKPSIRCQRDEFKFNIKSFIKPKRHKFFAFGLKRGCALGWTNPSKLWVGA